MPTTSNNNSLMNSDEIDRLVNSYNDKKERLCVNEGSTKFWSELTRTKQCTKPS